MLHVAEDLWAGLNHGQRGKIQLHVGLHPERNQLATLQIVTLF